MHEERPSAAAGAPATSQGHDSAAAEVPASSQSQGSAAAQRSQSKGSRPKKARSQTTWPTDVMVVGEVNDEGLPLDSAISTRLSRVCGLAGRQKVPLTLDNFDDLSDDQKKEIFNDAIQPYVQYPEELKEMA